MGHEIIPIMAIAAVFGTPLGIMYMWLNRPGARDKVGPATSTRGESMSA